MGIKNGEQILIIQGFAGRVGRPIRYRTRLLRSGIYKYPYAIEIWYEIIFLTLLFLILGDPILKKGLDSFQMCGKRAQISRIIVLRNSYHR